MHHTKSCRMSDGGHFEHLFYEVLYFNLTATSVTQNTAICFASQGHLVGQTLQMYNSTALDFCIQNLDAIHSLTTHNHFRSTLYIRRSYLVHLENFHV
jgi:hypothetical protein